MTFICHIPHPITSDVEVESNCGGNNLRCLKNLISMHLINSYTYSGHN